MRSAPRRVSMETIAFFVVFRTFAEEDLLRRFAEHPDRRIRRLANRELRRRSREQEDPFRPVRLEPDAP